MDVIISERVSLPPITASCLKLLERSFLVEVLARGKLVVPGRSNEIALDFSALNTRSSIKRKNYAWISSAPTELAVLVSLMCAQFNGEGNVNRISPPESSLSAPSAFIANLYHVGRNFMDLPNSKSCYGTR